MSYTLEGRTARLIEIAREDSALARARAANAANPDYVPPDPNDPQYQGDAEWLYGNSPAGLRMQAAESLAAEFGTDVSEWTV